MGQYFQSHPENPQERLIEEATEKAIAQAEQSDDDDAVGTFVEVKIDQAAKSRQIQTAVFEHGRYDGDEAALDHGGSLNRKAGF